MNGGGYEYCTSHSRDREHIENDKNERDTYIMGAYIWMVDGQVLHGDGGAQMDGESMVKHEIHPLLIYMVG